MWLSWHYHQVIINKPLLDFEKKLWLSASILWKDTLFQCYCTLKRHFGRVPLDFEKTSWLRATGLWKDTLVECYLTLKRHRYLQKGSFLYIKSKVLKSHRILWIYELPEFSSKNEFPGNSIFISSIWVITLTDLSSNLFWHEPFEQSFLHVDHKNLNICTESGWQI